MMQTKDLDKKLILNYLQQKDGVWASRWEIQDLFGEEIPHKLVLSAIRSLAKRRLLEGCTCGCRGDFEITALGRELIGKI